MRRSKGVIVSRMNSGNRIAWPDSARGIAIILVVLYHTVQWGDWLGLATAEWLYLSGLLQSMRMPLFFTVAGLFATKWIREKPWQELIGSKIAMLLWVYMVWVALRYAFFLFVPRLGDPEPYYLSRLLAAPLLPSNHLWFIYALAVYFVTAKLLRRIDWRIQLGPAVVLSAFALTSWPYLARWDGVLAYYAFFILGVNARTWVLGIANRTQWSTACGVIVIWAVAYVLLERAGLTGVVGINVALRAVGVAAGICLAILAQRIVFVRFLGQRTLPIYLSHSMWIIAAATPVSLMIPPGSIWLQLWPVAMTAVAIVISLGLYQLATRVGFTWLYASPAWLQRAISVGARRISNIRSQGQVPAPEHSEVGTSPTEGTK